MAREGRTIGRVEGTIAHGKMLSVIPHRGDGVAVVVIHHCRTVHAASLAQRRGVLWELVHEAAIHRLLLSPISVIHGACHGIGGAQPLRVGSRPRRTVLWG